MARYNRKHSKVIMKVSGFSFIKDAIKYDYPIVEAINSVLPICDEFVIAVGKSSDSTLELIKSIPFEKIRIIETEWDEANREGGRVLAIETNKAFAEVAADSDWAFYVQGDEAIHEQYLDEVHNAMLKYKDDGRVDGLLFNYLHFYGSYDYVGSSSKWYNREIRVIRNDKSIYSYRDAQGFRKGENKKLNVKPINAYMYHYGWVKDPRVMQQKQENFNKYWHDDQWMDENIAKVEEFDYANIDQLQHFTGTHPKVMQNRIATKNWKFDFDLSMNKISRKEKIKRFLSKLGIETGYRNYRII